MTAPQNPCQSACWMDKWAMEATCSLAEDHDGPHVDMHEGWEW